MSDSVNQSEFGTANQGEFRTAEEVLRAASDEVQEVVLKTLRLARSTATGRAAVTKDDVIEIIRGVVR